MRCPYCDGANPDTATFCGQCYARFEVLPDVQPPGVQPAGAQAPEAPSSDPQPPGGAEVPMGATPARAEIGAPPGRTAMAGRFSAVDGSLSWRCGVCDTDNELATFVCAVCGAKMDAEHGDAQTDVDWEAAKRAEALVPGLGHLRTGHGGMGLSRMGIVGLWLIGSFTLATGGGVGLLTAAPLIIGMAVVWITGPADLDAARAERRPRLDAQRFLYLVIGVTVGVIVMGGLALLQ